LIFLSLGISGIQGIKYLGLFTAILAGVNSLFLFFFYPALIVFYQKYFANCETCLAQFFCFCCSLKLGGVEDKS
jgi:hypothetical protein